MEGRQLRGRVIRSLRLLGHYMRFNLSAGMEYRGSFLIQVLGMVLNNSAFIVFWLILFERIGGTIKGYGFRDVMFLWALAAAGFGIAGVLWGNSHFLSRLITYGELDVYLLQPKPVLPNVLASRMSVSAWGDILYGLLLFGFTQPLYPHKVLLFLLFCLLMAVALTAIRVLYHSLSFLWGNAEEFAGTASELVLSFMLYPGSVFEGPSSWLLHSLLPAAILAYIPARLFARFDASLFLIVLASDGAIVAAAVLAFHAGLRRYESGNRIGARI